MAVSFSSSTSKSWWRPGSSLIVDEDRGRNVHGVDQAKLFGNTALSQVWLQLDR